jgi:hypothetical protein
MTKTVWSNLKQLQTVFAREYASVRRGRSFSNRLFPWLLFKFEGYLERLPDSGVALLLGSMDCVGRVLCEAR